MPEAAEWHQHGAAPATREFPSPPTAVSTSPTGTQAGHCMAPCRGRGPCYLASSSICNGLLERTSAHADASGHEQSLKQS